MLIFLLFLPTTSVLVSAFISLLILLLLRRHLQEGAGVVVLWVKLQYAIPACPLDTGL